MRVLNGGPAKPTDKPPRPFEEGVSGLPTLVSNVETLANLPFLHRHGAEAFRQHGTSTSPGTFLATITGAGRPPALYEIPHGVAFTDLLKVHGVPADQVSGVLMGGYFAGLVNRDMLDATLDHETSLLRLNSGLGCGAIAILTDDCPVAVAASVMAYYDRENAGQCGSCFNGTAAMSAVTEALRDGLATRRGPGPAGALVGGATRPRCVRDAGRRHQRRGQPAGPIPPAGRQPYGKRLHDMPIPAPSVRCARMKWRR